ncbi:Imm42 family immunity protein [Acinetobacter junii]|uniref:Imm42 family immunity protein n=1 Tax=Acinetobacter junii TaxID=40215 RepID=UPI00321298AC
MIFGNPYKFSLYIDNFFYIDSMKDWDCMCGYYINGKPCISDYSQMLFNQKESILNGSLANIKYSETIYNLPLSDAFEILIRKRFPNFLGKSEHDFLETSWIEPDDDYMSYDANLESSNFGNVRYKLFAIGFKSSIRIISYIGSNNYYNLSKVDKYSIEECFINISELKNMIKDFNEWQITCNSQ